MAQTDSDQKSSNRHSIHALQSVIKRNEGILIQDYLDLHDFEDMPIPQLGLSVRATNCLMREFGEEGTLRSVLEMPLKSLISLKNTGAKTVQEILSRVEELADTNTGLPVTSSELLTLENAPAKRGALAVLKPFAALIAEEKWDEIESQLETDAEEDALIRVMDYAELIGADMVAAALSDPYPTEVLLPAFQEFVREQAELGIRRRDIQNLVDQLPEDRKELPVKPFLMTWSRRDVAKALEITIDDILTFSQLAELSAQFSVDEYNALRTFLPWCAFDIEKDIAKVMDRCIRDDRAREVVTLRAEGKTLAEVGDHFQITRERIRQIEAKAVRRCKSAGAEAVLLKISNIRGGDEILTADEIKGYCGSDGDLFLHLLRNMDDLRRFRYTKTLDAFILGNEEVEEEHVRAFVDELPDRIEEGSLSTYLEQATEQGIPSELVELQIHSDYNFFESSKTLLRGRSTIRRMCKEILPSFDPDGVHVSVSGELKEFRDRLYQRFGSEIRIPDGDRALSAIIYDVGMLRDRGTYVAVRDNIIPEELLAKIRSYVDSGNNEVYMFNTLYEVFRNELLQIGVDNRYFLQGILKHEWEGIYSFSRDCISKGKRATNIYDTVEAFIKNAGNYVSSAEIKEAFPGITDAVLNLALTQKKIVACGGKYIHADALHFDETIVRLLQRALETLMEDGQAHHSRELYDLANNEISDWMDEVGVNSHSMLFGIAAYLFDDRCVFSRPWIAKKGTQGEETIRSLRSRSSSADTVEWAPLTPNKDESNRQAENAVPVEMAARWNAILSEEFKDGLRLNGMRLRKFRGIYEERYHEAIEPDDEKLIVLLKSACDFRDDRVYEKQDDEQASLMDTIRKEILDTLIGGASCVYPQQIFNRYKEQLGEQLSIYTTDAFMSMLLDPAKCSFRVVWGLFCLSGKSVNVSADVLGAFQKSYAPVTYSQLAEQLWYIPFDKIKHELAIEPSLVNIDQETYFYAPHFPISTEELAALRRAMQRRINDEGYIVARDLRELMQTYCPNAVMDTASWKDWGVRDVIGWLLRDAFDFTGIVICAKGAGIGTAQVFRSFCKTRQRLTLDELKDLCTQLEVSGIYWGDVTAEMVRISQTDFVSKRNVAFDVEATDAVLETICTGEYMPLKTFTLFMGLPGASFPWNGFLLESYLRDYSRTFRLEQAGPTETTYVGAMVRRKSKIKTMQDLLIDVLAHDDSWTNVKEALTFISQQGYRSSRTMANATEIIKTAQALRERLRAAKK